jgi:hypothetical protein
VIVAPPVAEAKNVDAAVMAVDPGATAVTTPEALTVATELLPEVQVTVRGSAESAVTVATSATVLPTVSVADAGVTTTDVMVAGDVDAGSTVVVSLVPHAASAASAASDTKPVSLERTNLCIVPPGKGTAGESRTS